MTQYIDKSALVAEIKGYISNYKEIVAKTNRNDSTWVDSVSMIESKIGVLQHVLFFLDTLEVKDIQEEPVNEDERAKEAFCKATCNGHPPRSTCTSLGTCKEYDNFVKFMERKKMKC